MQNNLIKCDVNSCNHNNIEEGTCQLEKIQVSCTCNKDKCSNCLETICESFETTGGVITDNEYEVTSEI